ncbi:helix-turn-helix transcriptional regulator [Chryseobacterium wangxinyae]|uniref:helix-turn-helix domain-containing protein n=1 Tax=Chryseobacterium sp. CY350 TaxID=2997336 RepID=UPI00226D6075|nr:helix-turn-helix transcriptional regulator [Chryseobacterium sp. CY350]MCY0976426.1 helix-turn-helix transcriptional regulator [Chryseobacterium sp. CY350]WBZ93978.1 helix-turn-helix transcriptional regulator [Chryseobacterium sp. CY350]
MSLRKYQEKSNSPHPHIGEMVRKVMVKRGVSQAELARKMNVTSSSMAQYLQNSSLQFGILWNLGIALEHDFLTELLNYYPATISLNEKSKLVSELRDKTMTITDLEKKIKIYKSALGIRD